MGSVIREPWSDGELVDDDGYPAEDFLDWLARYLGDKRLWVRTAATAWSDTGAVRTDGETIILITGGWSGNEEIIGAMRQNLVMWSMSWLISRRGGVFVFEV